ncbi:hypothetical protein J6590_083321 [Homalodisca vitripennis]|nr:hypothetical protein J6590_083321 [Homalodisca vitripennis]
MHSSSEAAVTWGRILNTPCVPAIAAFDILLDKLVAVGLRGTALAWFSSYFKERRQVVSICGHNSDEQTVDYGDPRLSFTQTGDQPDLDPSSSPGARHITVLCMWSNSTDGVV